MGQSVRICAHLRFRIVDAKIEDFKVLVSPSPDFAIGVSYENLEEIGRGGFGVVYRAKCIAKNKAWYGNIVAIKKIDISKVPGFRVGLELQALANLHHESIVDFYEEFRENGAQYIVMEYCKHGSLRDYVKKNGKLSDQCAAFILRQLVNAVKHIHSNGMMHRDLSAGNVLISSMRNGKFRVKLADFGLATLLRQGDVTGTIVGTPGYIAPQVYGRSYNQKADVFSLGGILYLMLVGKDPPREQNITKELDLGILSEEGAELIRQMMHPDENRRIILQDIRMSAFSRMADEFDYYQLSYAQPVRMRAHSAQPRVTSNTKPNKESGFESGDVEFANVRRQSFENTCRHSLYDGSICQRCGLRRSRERRIEGIPSTSCSPVGVHAYNGLERLGRLERRVHGSRRMLSDARMSSTRGITIGSGVSGGTANVKLWPLDISRIAPNKMIIGAGRFFFNVNGTLVYEVAGKHRSVSRECHGIDECIACIVVVETKAANGQVMSIYSTAKNTPFPHADDPPLHLDRACYKIYRSFEELQLNSSHMRFYRQIVEATKRLGRLAVQKRGTDSISVSDDGTSKATLSDEEMRLFHHSRSDALEMEQLLEKGAFLCVKPFPFHFSNASLFTTAAVADKRPSDKENAQRTVVSERAVNRRPSLSKFCSEESNGRLSRKPLGTIAINSHIDDGHNVQRKSNASCGVENQQPVLETYPEDFAAPRILREGEYKLRAQRDSLGKRIITSILSVGVQPTRSVRVSTTSPNTYVYEVGAESAQTSRFRFDGRDFSGVPLLARNLLYTLCRKREEYA
ncbi:unnamed protein product [Toxocara canis]|uniref:Protein kinase domain-containing protein n=1 Tax=Toxocara canis TaxID=6265 RepID=A0A183UYJ6_TOXCA|nr:unnamed protein product [Toxocara canis]